MGCVCCSLSSFVSILLNAFERITLCTVCAALTCCLLFTIITVLVIGIGIGFHYCSVQNSVDAMEKAAQAAGALRSGGGPAQSPMMRSVNKAVKRGFAHRLGKRDQADEKMPSNNNTINDIMLFGRNSTYLQDFITNSTSSSGRARRDLTAVKSSDDVSTDKNKFSINFVAVNGTLPLEYADEESDIIFSNRTVNAFAHNDTIYNTMLLRQNCTLLNFFTRFF